MKQKISSRNKILIAAILLGIFLVGAIVSIVLVLAASTQNVSSNIRIAYIADGVGAKIKANYAIVPQDITLDVSKTSMKTTAGSEEIVFNISNNQKIEEIAPEGDIVLNPQNQTIVFEYVFENIAESAFSLELTAEPTAVNMTETYYVSNAPLDENAYQTRITKTSLEPQSMTYYGQKLYVYIMAKVTNENLTASYDGGFVWNMQSQDTININLNNGGSVSTLRVIPNTITGLEDIAMPCIEVENASDTSAFIGYYTQENGGGTKYINQFGTSVHTADLAEGTTLYAYTDTVMTITDGTMTLTEAGKKLTEVVVPDSVTEIGENTFKDNTTVESVVVSNSVTTIADNAFEGCTNLTSVTYSDGTSIAYADSTISLESIGNYAFKNCINLKTIKIPSSVKSIGIGAFEVCVALDNVVFENANYWTLSDVSDDLGNDIGYLDKTKIAKLLKGEYATKYLIYDAWSAVRYPQTYVGETLNTTLKSEYIKLANSESSALIETGKTYTIYKHGNIEICKEYRYQDSDYVRLESALPYTSNTKDVRFLNSSGGGSIITGEEYWFKVEPIEFDDFTLSDGTKVKMAKMVLASNRVNMQEGTNPNNWATSSLRDYLNGVFARESGLENVAKEYTQYSTAYEYSSPAEFIENGMQVTDKVWLADCSQIQEFYGTANSSNKELRKVATDFARATRTYYMDSYFKVLNGVEEYSTLYWLRSTVTNEDIINSIFRCHPNGGFNTGTCDGSSPGLCPVFAY